MTRTTVIGSIFLIVLALAVVTPANGQLSTTTTKFVEVANGYRLAPNIT